MESDMQIAWNKVVSHLQSAMEENRLRQWNLRYETLDHVGILRALSWFSCETEKEYADTIVEYSTSIEESEIPERLKPLIFRVVYQSVANAIFHGKSSRIQIALKIFNCWLQLKVQDNGKGFNSAHKEQLSGNGFGLDHMQNQVECSGGIFSIRSIPGKGATVIAEWKMF